MVAAKDFVIDQVSWHTTVKGNPETPEMVRQRFKSVVHFLQDNGLVVQKLLGDNQIPENSFCIRVSDLTDEGFQLMKRGYEKWLRQVVNKRKDTSDMSILGKALGAIRKQKSLGE